MNMLNSLKFMIQQRTCPVFVNSLKCCYDGSSFLHIYDFIYLIKSDVTRTLAVNKVKSMWFYVNILYLL